MPAFSTIANVKRRDPLFFRVQGTPKVRGFVSTSSLVALLGKLCLYRWSY